MHWLFAPHDEALLFPLFFVHALQKEGKRRQKQDQKISPFAAALGENVDSSWSVCVILVHAYRNLAMWALLFAKKSQNYWHSNPALVSDVATRTIETTSFTAFPLFLQNNHPSKPQPAHRHVATFDS